jgi:hypothetical protein
MYMCMYRYRYGMCIHVFIWGRPLLVAAVWWWQSKHSSNLIEMLAKLAEMYGEHRVSGGMGVDMR